MKTEKNENEPTASEVLEGFNFRLSSSFGQDFRLALSSVKDPPRIRHSRFTEKKIDEAAKELKKLKEVFERDKNRLGLD